MIKHRFCDILKSVINYSSKKSKSNLKENNKSMKLLSIGNSFSQDAQKWLHTLAVANDFDLQTQNLYIGGCSLERHWENAMWDKPDYLIEKNGESTTQYCSIYDALNTERWDVITFQQVSHYSGMPQTYVPYLDALASIVRRTQPRAQVYFHQTWAYETDSDHWGFATYNRDQKEMYRRIVDASEMASEILDAPIIPVGRVIQTLRETLPEFDVSDCGLSLCRDGFHLTLDYGRFAAAATWLKVLSGKTPHIEKFKLFDPYLLNKIIAVVDTI